MSVHRQIQERQRSSTGRCSGGWRGIGRGRERFLSAGRKEHNENRNRSNRTSTIGNEKAWERGDKNIFGQYIRNYDDKRHERRRGNCQTVRDDDRVHQYVVIDENSVDPRI